MRDDFLEWLYLVEKWWTKIYGEALNFGSYYVNNKALSLGLVSLRLSCYEILISLSSRVLILVLAKIKPFEQRKNKKVYQRQCWMGM